MKQLRQLCLIGTLSFIACNSQNKQLVGDWKFTLPQEKIKQIRSTYALNEQEILNMKEVNENLADQYGTNDLEELKGIMLEELKHLYEPPSLATYRFTKEGFLIAISEKNGAEDTVFNYECKGNELYLQLVDESKAFSESGFEEGSILTLLDVGKDTLKMTLSAGTFVDTIFMLRQKQ
jgi:hypothetical protein